MKSNKRAFVFILLNTSIHLWRYSSHWKGERKQKPKAPENIFSAISGTEVPPPPGCIFNTKAQTPSVCSQISPGPASGSQDSDPVPSAGLVWPVRCPLGETVPGLPFPGPSAEQGAGEAGGTGGGVRRLQGLYRIRSLDGKGRVFTLTAGAVPVIRRRHALPELGNICTSRLLLLMNDTCMIMLTCGAA